MSEKNRQGSLLDYLEAMAAETRGIAPGSLSIAEGVKEAMAEDIRHARDEDGRLLSRYDVAARMSAYLGCDITKSILDNWTAPSHPGHVMRSDYLPAFARATGGRRTWECLARHAGLFVLPGEEALRADLHRDEEQIKEIQRRRQEKTVMLRRLTEPGQ